MKNGQDHFGGGSKVPHVWLNRPADKPLGKQIQHTTSEEPAFKRLPVGDVGKQHLIWHLGVRRRFSADVTIKVLTALAHNPTARISA